MLPPGVRGMWGVVVHLECFAHGVFSRIVDDTAVKRFDFRIFSVSPSKDAVFTVLRLSTS